MKRPLYEFVLTEYFIDWSSAETVFDPTQKKAAVRALHTSRADWVRFEYVYGPRP